MLSRIIILLFLLFLFFPIQVYGEENLEKLCYEILRKEIISTDFQNKEIKDYDYIAKNYDINFQAQDFLFSLSFLPKSFEVKEYNYGEKGGFDLKGANTYYQLWDSGVSKYAVHKHSTYFIYSKDFSNELLYCRHRIMEVLKPNTSLYDIKNNDILMKDSDKPFNIEIIKTKNNIYKKVFINRIMLGMDGTPLLNRKEWFVIPLSKNSFFSPYNLIDDYKKTIDDYNKWKSIIITPKNNNNDFEKIYDKKNIKILMSKNPVIGFNIDYINNALSTRNFVKYTSFRNLTSLLLNNQKLVFKTIFIKNKNNNKDYEKYLDVIYKNNTIENSGKDFINIEPLILTTKKILELAEKDHELINNNESLLRLNVIKGLHKINIKHNFTITDEYKKDIINYMKILQSIKEKKQNIVNHIANSPLLISISIIWIFTLLCTIIIVIKKKKT